MSEWSEQREVIIWFKQTFPLYERSIRLSMNGVNLGGGKKAAIMINQMKAQGMVKEESDLFFAIPAKGYFGLFIEMKDFGKKPTQGQEDYLHYQRSMGYSAIWCEGAQAAIKAIKDYMTKVC